MSQSAADRIAALKARVAAAVGNNSRGGLSVGLHPALEDLGSVKPTTQQATRTEIRSNPYLDTNPADQGPASKPKAARPLQFNQKGKYIQQGNALRKQEALEQLKARIAETTRKAGIDESQVEKSFVIEAPPAIEWWDEAFFPEDMKKYDGIDDASYHEMITKITGPNEVISSLIQHPVPLEPPQDKLYTGLKPLYMTRREQKKIRRQRRMAEMKEHQAKQRLGLEPTPGPKVKRANLMRILGDSAVKDPTATEARVNKEIAERHQKHIEQNEARKLTTDQRHDKLASNQEKDASKGIHLVVFKINNLADGKHRFKIGKNAEQLALTGICILHPTTNLVFAEGGEWSINKYKKLMLNRVDWTHGTPPVSENRPERDWLKGEADLSSNRCQLLFEGEIKTRAFKKWSSKICDTDRDVIDVLTRVKLESFWAQARKAS